MQLSLWALRSLHTESATLSSEPAERQRLIYPHYDGTGASFGEVPGVGSYGQAMHRQA